jgi:hypothetical protein
MSDKPKKTPSPKTIAALLITRALHDLRMVSTEDIAEKAHSRISLEKREKILDQVAKMTKSLRDRCVNALSRAGFRGPD